MTSRPPLRRLCAAALMATLLLGGCATTTTNTENPRVAHDPWEGFNRKVFAFNEVLDEKLARPVAETYRDVVPQLVRTGVGNFIGNIGDLWSAANHLLQGKLQAGVEMGIRFVTNSFFGLGGILDPASEMGLTRRSEDFGQTLAVWGVGAGPYVVLPLLGPSTVRDSAGLVADRQMAPSVLFGAESDRYAMTTLEVVHGRAVLLGTTALLSSVALDKYSFTREAWLSRRQDQIFDGAPPIETFEDIGDSNPAPSPAK